MTTTEVMKLKTGDRVQWNYATPWFNNGEPEIECGEVDAGGPVLAIQWDDGSRCFAPPEWSAYWEKITPVPATSPASPSAEDHHHIDAGLPEVGGPLAALDNLIKDMRSDLDVAAAIREFGDIPYTERRDYGFFNGYWIDPEIDPSPEKERGT